MLKDTGIIKMDNLGSLKNEKYAVGVILYNPSEKNILTLSELSLSFSKIIFYDNSSFNNLDLIQKYMDKTEFEYCFNGINEGISIPFNSIRNRLIKEGYTYCLFMDQDSIFSKEDITSLLFFCENNNRDNVAIFCPRIAFQKDNIQRLNSFERVDFCITSGSLVNLNIFSKLDGYDENLFIDGVDREYALKLKQNGYCILQYNNSLLYQELGEKPRNLLGVFEHSPLRNYYISRNRLYVVKKYKSDFSWYKYCKYIYLSQLKQLLSILLFEDKKMYKIKFFIKGRRDFFRGNFGKYGDKYD